MVDRRACSPLSPTLVPTSLLETASGRPRSWPSMTRDAIPTNHPAAVGPRPIVHSTSNQHRRSTDRLDRYRVRDGHDLTQAETMASEARYRGLLEAAPDAMVVVDQAGAIVLLNMQAEKQFGYRRDELLGQAVTNIIPDGFAERLIADDLRSTEDALAQQIGTGIELIARRKDGSEFPIEIMLSPLESAEGILVTAAIRDISVRKEMEGRY